MLKNNRQMKKNHFKNEWGPIKLTSISNRIVVIVSVHKQFTFLCITVIMIVLRDIELRRKQTRQKMCGQLCTRLERIRQERISTCE